MFRNDLKTVITFRPTEIIQRTEDAIFAKCEIKGMKYPFYFIREIGNTSPVHMGTKKYIQHIWNVNY